MINVLHGEFGYAARVGFPFRFYGAHPADWEAAPPAYAVTFAARPDSHQAARLEHAFVQAIRLAGITGGPLWVWDGATALVILDERVPDWGQFFDDIALVLRALHVHAAIAQVIFLHALLTGDDDDDDDDEWGSWSRGQGAPMPGPRFGYDSVFD